MCYLPLLAVVIILPLLLPQSNAHTDGRGRNGRDKRHLQLDTSHPKPASKPEENAWYRAVTTAVRQITNESCYVCTPAKPRPLNISETMGVMVAFTNSPDDWVDALNISIVNYNGSVVRFWNVTHTPPGVYESVMTTNPTQQRGEVCFTRTCWTLDDHYLGTSACRQCVAATCGEVWESTQPSPRCRCESPLLGRLNLTGTTSLYHDGDNNPVVAMPSSDGFGALRQHVWVCGPHVYQALRPGWCGSCYLAKLLPSVTIVPNLTYHHTHYTHYYNPHKARRSTTRVSELEKGFGGAFPKSTILPWRSKI